MAGRRPPQRNPVPVVQTPKVADTETQRALDTVVAAVQALQARRAPAAVTVTGSRAGGDALESLLAALVAQGIIVDETEA